MKKVLFIINPISGQKEIVLKLGEVIKVFTSNDYYVDLHFIVNYGDNDKFIKECAKGKKLIVCAGGDGTLNTTINAMMKYKVKLPLGYIPCGSTNDFGHSVGLPMDVVKAAKVIVKGKPQALDIGKYGNKYFVYVAAFGAFTRSSYSTPQDLKNLFGHFAYVVNGMTEIPNIREEDIKITTDKGDVVSGKYLLGTISNSKKIAGLIDLSTSGVDLSDGYFELMLIGIPKTLKDLEDISSFINTKETKGSMFTFIKAKEFKVVMKKDSMWSIDGEGVKIKKSEKFTNIHNAIRIIK